MRNRAARTPEGFEDFYKEVRGRLLLQTYALTGDLVAAQRAVRDAFVVAWHHWRKVARLDQPEDWVRPLAWTRALRRSQARRWSRQKGIDPRVRAVLDALGQLSTTQRKVLLLTVLAAAPLEGIAREVGVPRTIAERELQTATALFAMNLGVTSTAIRAELESLAPEPASIRWPRPSILMRQGSARRRAHTTVGAVAAVAVLAVAGSLVTDASGVHPALATKGILHARLRPTEHAKPTTPPPPDPLTTAAMLGTAQVTSALRGTWVQGETSRNTAGDGLVFTCQGGRYADPKGIGALVRQFTGTLPKGRTLTAGQDAEASASQDAAKQTYRTTLDWYAGCMSPRVQLVSTDKVSGVGDDATLLVLRHWGQPTSTQVVGVARTGRLTTSVITTVPDPKAAGDQPRKTAGVDLDAQAGLLAAAVNGMCTLPDHGACSTTPTVKEVGPVAVGTEPALLSEVDLPPVTGIEAPWAGTDPHRATTNAAATRCDQADFSTPDFSHAVTRTFVIPTAQQLPAEFGLAETAGALPAHAAAAFVDDLRSRLKACHTKDLGTDVEQLADDSDANHDLTVWKLDVKISDSKSVDFLMAIIRNHTAVAQLTFVPSGDASISHDDFLALAHRAEDRLAQLGQPH